MRRNVSSLLDMLNSAGKEPLAHDQWIAAWKKLYDQFEHNPSSSLGFAELEHEALGNLMDVRVTNTHDHLNHQVCQLLDTFKHLAFLVDSEGYITAQNAMVNANYDINVGDSIESLPIALHRSESLKSIVKALCRSGLKDGQALFKQACELDSSHELTLAITSSTGANSKSVLVFVISTYFSDKSAKLIKGHYGLTGAECEILISFVTGYSLKDIARLRNRSQATVRTQFSSLLTKMGARCQASLLRIALSVSDFTTELKNISTVLEHPYRRQAQLIREGGRMIEVSYCGNPKGLPLVHIPHAADNRFNAEVEKQFYEAGLYVVNISPPAQGKTDPPEHGQTRNQVYVEDVEFVLNMLNIDCCPVMIRSAGSSAAFQLAAALPKRISRVVLIGGCPPGRYWTRHGTGASWVDAVLRIGEKYPAMRKIIVTAGVKAWVTVGAKQFQKLQLAANKNDQDIQMRPENVLEIEYALESATTFGINPVLEDIGALFVDNIETINRSNCSITIIHGVDDAVLPVNAMRDFQADFSSRVELFEFKDAGFTVLSSHTEEVVNLVAQATKDAKELHRRYLSTVESPPNVKVIKEHAL